MRIEYGLPLGEKIRRGSAHSGERATGGQQFDLDWLLHPIAREDFFDAHWESSPVLIARDDPTFFADLPGLDSVDQLIATTVPGAIRPTDEGRMVRTDRDGRTLIRHFRRNSNGTPDIHDVYHAYEDGYTIVLNRLHHRSAPVARLCHSLESAFHHPVGVNLYLTPRGGQGLGVHVDTHDVFILQLHGTKEWRIAEPPKVLPLARSERPELAPGLSFRSYTLTPGDVLYLPRGFPHRAMTASSSSLHFTVGIFLYRWVDVLKEALRLVAEQDSEFRSALPIGFLDSHHDTEHLRNLADRLMRALADESLLEHVKGSLGSDLLRPAKAPTKGHFRTLDTLPDLTSASVVARQSGLLCRVHSSPVEAKIEFSGNFVAGPPVIEPALRFIAGRERFTIGDLPGELSAGDKVDLVARLVTEGLLHCTTTSKEGENR